MQELAALPGEIMPYPPSRYRFGSFEITTKTRELHKHGIKLKLRPQAYQVLLLLVERSGDVVTREELQKRVWPSNTYVDFEHGLNTAIKELRGKLSDSASEPKYIETLPKLGYRLMVPMQPVAGVVAEGVEDPKRESRVSGNSTAQAAAPAAAGEIISWRWAVAFALGALAIAILVAILKWPRSQPLPPAQLAEVKGRVMLAVVPFENLTGDVGQDYFSDGLTEEMIAQLGRLDPHEFGVIARTSVMYYKHSSAKTDQIGRELGVRYVLEGSVRRDSGKVRINAELIEAGTQTQIWTKEYNRELTNLLAMQAEIAHEISDEIQSTLGKPTVSSPARLSSLTPQAYQAHDLYLRGLYFWNKRTISGFEQAIQYFQQAIDTNADYAPAYAGLANSYALLTSYSITPATKYMPKARAAALRAVELDDNSPEAHAALALVVENYDWDWNTSEREYRRAIALNPNYATAHQWYAELLTWQGRFDEAARECENARGLDPLSLIIATDQAAMFYYSRRFDQAIEKLRQVQEMDPDFPRAHQIINVYAQMNRNQDAMADLENWQRTLGEGPGVWVAKAFIYCRSGQKEKAEAELQKVEAANRKQPIDPSAIVVVNLCLGNKERAIGLLQKAFEQHSNAMTTLKVEPAYDPLRSDPRFQDLMRKVGLAR